MAFETQWFLGQSTKSSSCFMWMEIDEQIILFRTSTELGRLDFRTSLMMIDGIDDGTSKHCTTKAVLDIFPQ